MRRTIAVGICTAALAVTPSFASHVKLGVKDACDRQCELNHLAKRISKRHTPFGKWAIPSYIVMCESRGERYPHENPIDSYYQIIPSTWADMRNPADGDGVSRHEQHQLKLVGAGLKGTPAATEKLGQDVVADAVADTSGLSQWTCA